MRWCSGVLARVCVGWGSTQEFRNNKCKPTNAQKPSNLSLSLHILNKFVCIRFVRLNISVKSFV